MNFKDRLRRERLRAGLTQAALAQAAGITTRSIQNYEMGARRPQDYEIVCRLAAALNLEAEQLLEPTGSYGAGAGKKGGAKASRENDHRVGTDMSTGTRSEEAAY